MKLDSKVPGAIICLILAAVILACAQSGYGASLEVFRAKIETARALAVTVETNLRSDAEDGTATRELVENIRNNFPAGERVEWSGGTAEVSNSWLLETTKALETEADTLRRTEFATAIREYLSSIAYKLNELDRLGIENRSKDEDRQKLAEILRREEYQKPQQAEQSTFQRWLKEFLEWIANLWPKPSVPDGDLSALQWIGGILRILFYVGLIALLGFIVFKIVPLLVPNLKREARSKKKSRVILGEHIEENKNASDLFIEAENLARAGDLRGAIRKGYVALLCDLSDRKIIGLARHKTNRDYLRDVRGRSDLHPRLKRITDTFERHWYGFQESSDHDWSRFREEYEQATRSA